MRYKFILSSIHHLWLSLLFLAICWWGLLLWFFCDILKFSFSDLFPFEFSLVKLFLFEIQLFGLNLFSLLFLLFVILCSLLKDLLINSLNAFIIAIWSPYPVLHIYVLVGAFWNSVTGFCLGCILWLLMFLFLWWTLEWWCWCWHLFFFCWGWCCCCLSVGCGIACREYFCGWEMNGDGLGREAHKGTEEKGRGIGSVLRAQFFREWSKLEWGNPGSRLQ